MQTLLYITYLENSKRTIIGDWYVLTVGRCPNTKIPIEKANIKILIRLEKAQGYGQNQLIKYIVILKNK